MSGPLAPTERLPFPDALRGFALLGILPVNLPVFALPLVYMMEIAPITGGRFETLGAIVSRVCFDQKFITLFSVLFGVGLGIQSARTQARGGSWGWFVTRRMSTLLLFGFLHALLLFWGDILGAYALVGVCCAGAVHADPRSLRWIGAALAVTPGLMLLPVIPMMFVVDWLETLDLGEAVQAVEYTPGLASGTWAEFLQGMVAWGPEFELELHREGPWIRLAVIRVAIWLLSLASMPMFYGLRIGGLFLIGISIAADGRLLRPHAHPELFRLLLVRGLAVGVPLHVCVALGMAFGSGYGVMFVVETLLYFGSLGLAAAYWGGMGLLVARVPEGVTLPLRSLGRGALTFYLLQSVLASVIFSSWGLGWFGSLHRGQLWAVVLGIWAVELVLASLWFLAFRQGPMEALWRRLTYGRAA